MKLQTLPAIISLFLFVSPYLLGSEEIPTETIVEEAALAHRLDMGVKHERLDQSLYFLETSHDLEDRLHSRYKREWFKKASDFATDEKGRHRLKSDTLVFGTCISVHEIEKTATGWRCIVHEHAGPLGSSSLRYYLEQLNGKWVVTKVVLDDTLPVS